jgi:hydroxypyruvate isomerase
MCLIEPLSTRPDYYLRSYSTAMDIVKSSKIENLKVMLDSFHLQRLHGNLTERVKVVQLPSTNSLIDYQKLFFLRN